MTSSPRSPGKVVVLSEMRDTLSLILQWQASISLALGKDRVRQGAGEVHQLVSDKLHPAGSKGNSYLNATSKSGPSPGSSGSGDPVHPTSRDRERQLAVHPSRLGWHPLERQHDGADHLDAPAKCRDPHELLLRARVQPPQVGPINYIRLVVGAPEVLRPTPSWPIRRSSSRRSDYIAGHNVQVCRLPGGLTTAPPGPAGQLDAGLRTASAIIPRTSPAFMTSAVDDPLTVPCGLLLASRAPGCGNHDPAHGRRG